MEVESTELSDGEERELRQRRIRFYRRNGAVMVLDGGAYRMPNLAGEGSLPMCLMWLPILNGVEMPTDLTLAGLYTLIFSETYSGEKNKPLLHAIIKAIPDPDSPIKLEESQ